MEFNLNEWLEYAEKVAASFATTFKRIDKEDIYQELALALITNEDDLREKLVGKERAPSYMKKVLQNLAWRYCTSENRKFIVVTDFYEYQTADVRIMLEQYLGGTSEGMLVPDDAKSVHGDDDLAIFGDIARVVDGLSETDQETLEQYLMTPENKDTAERQRYSRVVRKVTNSLNYNKRKASMDYEGTGTRRVVANRVALATTKSGYNMKEKDYA
ncbi:hypothetical protein [Streptomyces collinus]|uniref:hypothetical protein n=1 Tax=Streptomyces collinus TaxID=42684 RepID=UPI003682C8AF